MKNTDLESKISPIKTRHITDHLVGEEVLDVGSGYGYYSEWLVSQHPNFKVTAIDQLELMSCNGIEFLSTNLENPIPLHSNGFSTILAFDVIEHIANERQLIRELNRLCKQGGALIGSVPHDDDKFLPQYNVTFYHRSDLTHKRYYTHNSLRTALEDNGFHVILIEGKGEIQPQLFAEFFPQRTQFLVRKIIGVLRRLHIINTKKLSSDLFFVARKHGQPRT